MLRRILKNVAFTLTIWSVLFVLAEGILRVRHSFAKGAPDAPLSRLVMCQPDPTRIWRYKSLHHQIHKNPEFEVDVSTNELGLRDRSIESDSNDRAAVLAVGDSFTFGWGVEQSQRYSQRLEDRLGSPGNRIVNAGYWMYSFDQQLLAMRELVPRLRPRVVVQGLYAPHLLTLMSHSWERDASGRLMSVSNPGVRVAEDGSLRFTNQYLENPPFRSRLVGEVFRIWFNWRLAREGMTEDLPLLDPASTRFALAWRMCEQIIAETASFLEGEGVDYVAFGIPRDLQVSGEEWTDAYRAAVKGRRLDLDLPSRRLGDIVTRSGGAWVDLLPVFRTSYQTDLYFKHDVHWTREGHRLAAETLAPILKERMKHPPRPRAPPPSRQ